MNFESRARAGLLLAAVLVAVAVVAVNAQPGQRRTPFPAYYFEVEIDGGTFFFKSCSGLKIETSVIEIEEGGTNGSTIRKSPGVTRFANLRLSRGFTGDKSLYDWVVNVKKANTPRVNGRITMIDRRGVRIASWKFFNGFPVKWEGPEFDATKNELAIETIEIAHEGLVFVDDNN